jgi:hypothetical protein
MPPDDTLRATLGLSAIAGGFVWGVYHLATTLLAGQPVHRQDIILAVLNVAAAILVGGLVAYFVGPVLGPMIPLEGLRDPHALGFGIGAVAWEAAPFAYRWLRVFAAKKVGEGAP